MLETSRSWLSGRASRMRSLPARSTKLTCGAAAQCRPPFRAVLWLHAHLSLHCKLCKVTSLGVQAVKRREDVTFIDRYIAGMLQKMGIPVCATLKICGPTFPERARPKSMALAPAAASQCTVMIALLRLR